MTEGPHKRRSPCCIAEAQRYLAEHDAAALAEREALVEALVEIRETARAPLSGYCQWCDARPDQTHQPDCPSALAMAALGEMPTTLAPSASPVKREELRDEPCDDPRCGLSLGHEGGHWRWYGALAEAPEDRTGNGTEGPETPEPPIVFTPEEVAAFPRGAGDWGALSPADRWRVTR